MKRTAAILLAMSLLPALASAQSNKYPQSVKAQFDAADSAVTSAMPSTPLIAVPLTGGCEAEIFSSVQKAGGVPSGILPSADFASLRDAVTSFDGFVLTDSFSRKVDEEVADGRADCPALNLLKAVVDQNLPICGTSDVLKEINIGQSRIDDSFASYDEFVSRARLYKKAKQLMQRIFTLDTHNDQPCQYKRNASLGKRQTNQVSIPKMVEGYVDGSVIISYQGQGPLDEESTREAVEYCGSIIDSIYADAARYPDDCVIVRNEEEARAAKASGKKALFIAIENGYGIGNDLSNIRKYRDRGVIYMTLCHTKDNAICHTSSIKSPDRNLGLTKFGRKVVKELNACGVIVDLSHASEQTFWDACKLSKVPVVCSHSGSQAIFNHDRNITDDQMRELARIGGVCQFLIVDNFISPDEDTSSIDDMMKHIFHCIDVAGIDHVGIGTDFDGGGGAWGLNGDNDMMNITMRLIEHGLSDEDIAKIWSGNFFRVMKEVQAAARK